MRGDTVRQWIVQNSIYSLAAFGAGWLSGQFLLAFLIGVLVLLGYHITHIFRLYHWFANKRNTALPAAPRDALWRRIYDRAGALDRRNRKRKRKVNRIAEQYRDGVSALPDAVVAVNSYDQIVWCNRAAIRLLGIDPTRDLGQIITNLVRSPGFASFLARPNQQDIVITMPNKANLNLRVRVVDFGKRQRLILASDVSASIQSEKMRRDFVANVSHELRTPLTVLTGYLETLLEQESTGAENLRQPLTNMLDQSNRMRSLVNDLLLLSKLESAQAENDEEVNIAGILEQLLRDAKLLSGGSRHEFTTNIDSNLRLLGCESELHSAFANLIFNAVRHTPPGSAICIDWFGDEQGPTLIVADGGLGIAKTHLTRLTERFYRVDKGRHRDRKASTGGGTGLGLSIVDRVVQRHNGELTIQSEICEGSKFICRFPKSAAISTARADSSSEAEEIFPESGTATPEPETGQGTGSILQSDRQPVPDSESSAPQSPEEA